MKLPLCIIAMILISPLQAQRECSRKNANQYCVGETVFDDGEPTEVATIVWNLRKKWGRFPAISKWEQSSQKKP